MSGYDRVEFVVGCPSCKKEMKLKYGDVYGSRRSKCQRCSAEINYDANAASNLRSAVQELERAEEKVERARRSLFERAQIKLK